jgi:hypothetical protein
MASENKVCKTTITPTSIQLDFTNGDQLICPLNDLPQETILQAALFGLRRKVTNSFASANGNVAEALASAKETWAQLVSGVWTAPRETEPSAKAPSDLVEAVMAITGKDRQTVESKLDELSKEGRAALRKNPAVNAKLLEIRAERAKEKLTPDLEVSDLLG